MERSWDSVVYRHYEKWYQYDKLRGDLSDKDLSKNREEVAELRRIAMGRRERNNDNNSDASR